MAAGVDHEIVGLAGWNVVVLRMNGVGPAMSVAPLEKSNRFRRSKVLDGFVSSCAAEPGIVPTPQLYSMKFTTDAWSTSVWSTVFVFAYGEMTRSGRRGPKPHRPF